MKHHLFFVLIFSAVATTAFAQDDLLEKIKRLEQQIQELKTIKAQQSISIAKTNQCMKVVAREKFCTCIGNTLPHEVSFEEYVHTILTSKDELGYSKVSQDQKNTIDATLDAREKCIERGFFK